MSGIEFGDEIGKAGRNKLTTNSGQTDPVGGIHEGIYVTENNQYSSLPINAAQPDIFPGGIRPVPGDLTYDPILEDPRWKDDGTDHRTPTPPGPIPPDEPTGPDDPITPADPEIIDPTNGRADPIDGSAASWADSSRFGPRKF